MLTLQEQARSLTFLGQFSFFYSELGATGLNANTYPDMTIYFVNIPANRLEGWFWMESDRLLQPVFRELYKEIDVVHEERRLRIESNPIGILEEQVRLLFWGSHPYALGPQGRPEEVDRLTRPAARNFFEQHYRPENLTAALVGGFDPEQVKSWASRYFGRLRSTEQVLDTQQSRKAEPPPNLKERRFEANCDCTPQAQVPLSKCRVRTPGCVFSGRVGRGAERPHRSPLPISGTGPRDCVFGLCTTADLEAGRTILLFRRNQGRCSSCRPGQGLGRRSSPPPNRTGLRERDPENDQPSISRCLQIAQGPRPPLMSQLLYYEGLGDWRHVSEWPGGIRSVSAADVQRVAKQYLDPAARTVALYRRQTSAQKKQFDKTI